MKHSAYYTFMTYNIKNKLGTKEYLTSVVAKYESKEKLSEGEYEMLLDLIEATFEEDSESPEE